MATPQFFPIPSELCALACETISRRVEPVPFVKNNITITTAVVGIALECLNAEPTKTLPVRIAKSPGASKEDLAGCLEQRLDNPESAVASVIASVLIEAGIAESIEVLDRTNHSRTRGIRLITAFSWHNAAPLPQHYTPSPSPSVPETDTAWLGKCPVCKTGILQTIVGKRLYGIPPTDFYYDCTHCGAKFIPEKDQFRLVSIARIADPRWRSLLNTCRSSDDWAVMSQAVPSKRSTSSGVSGRSSLPLIKSPKRSANSLAVEGVPVSFPAMKDGSITVPYAAKTLYFKPVPLHYLTGVKRDVFGKSTRILADVLSMPAFSDLKTAVEEKYAKNLTLPLGRFVAELRQRADPLYHSFLNRFGDEEYSTFRVAEESHARQRGVVLVIVQQRLCYAGACPTSLQEQFDETFGRITPDMCFVDGDETACRINALLSAYKSTSAIYIHAIDDIAEMNACAEDLNKRYPYPSSCKG
ncbi:MAG: hypothetical protein WC391_08865 [Methanoregula sp.]|jgi:hypothetical protein